MKLIRLVVERPVTTVMFYMTLILLGIVALISLPREFYPTMSYPELLIVTHYGAAAPEEIENIVTKLIEEQAGTIPNVKKIRSVSKEGLSVVILQFNWGTDMGLAHLAVREKIDLIKDRLPPEAEEPIVQRYNPFAQPMLVLSISGNMSLAEITRIANDVVKKRLQKVEGVASAIVSGGQEREISVAVDLGKMESSNVSLTGVVDSLKTSNINYPAGTTQGRFYEYLVRTIGEFSSIPEIGKTVIAVDAPRESAEYMFRSHGQRKQTESFQPRAQRMLMLSSIAEITDTFKEVESYSRYNGRVNVSIAIQKQFDANTIKTARRVQSVLSELSLTLPKEIKIETVYDESKSIKNALDNVMTDGVIGSVFAFFVLLFFLRNFQDAFLVTLTLPMSIMVLFIFLYLTGRTINVMGLAGISLTIGSISDIAICVLDNIDKGRKKFGNPKEGSIWGASEIIVAQTTSIMTNIVVFLPLLFAKGGAQQLFKDLCYAAVTMHLASLAIALTLLPRVTAYPMKWGKKMGEEEMIGADDFLIGEGGKHPNSKDASDLPPSKYRIVRIWRWVSQGLTEERTEKMNDFYRKIFTWALSNKALVIKGTLGLFVLGILIFAFKTKIFMPTVDQGEFVIKVNMPVGTRLDVTNHVMDNIEGVLRGMPNVKGLLVRVGSTSGESIESLGPHQGECVVNLDNKKRKESTEKFILQFNKKLKKINTEGAEVESLLQDSSIKAMGSGVAPISVTVKGQDLSKLRNLSDEIQVALRNVRGIEGVKTSLALPSFENRVSVDKDRASGFGLSVSEIARASLIGIKGFVASYYKEEGKEVPILVRLREEDRKNPESIHNISIRTQQGSMVSLGDVANITSGYGPSEIQRMDQQRVIVVSAQVLGRSVSDVIEDVEKKIAPYKTIKDYSVELSGAKQEMKDSYGGLAIAFIFAFVLTYMIMAAGFESLLHPFLIMITVPLGVIGVAFTVLITFIPVSAPVVIAIVMLGGVVVNNGIVLIDHVNQLRKEGMNLEQAVTNGCVNRLRPIIMTAVTTILALLPTSLGIGEGTEMTSPMALATLGGFFISTLLTLVILPIIYVLVEERRFKGSGFAAYRQFS